MLRSTPPVITVSNCRSISPSIEASIAAIAEAHAASTMKLGPRRLKRFATRPARQLPSSPGIVSSVIGGRPSAIRACHSAAIAARTSAGSAAKLGAASRSRASSGNVRRRVVS